MRKRVIFMTEKHLWRFNEAKCVRCGLPKSHIHDFGVKKCRTNLNVFMKLMSRTFADMYVSTLLWLGRRARSLSNRVKAYVST